MRGPDLSLQTHAGVAVADVRLAVGCAPLLPFLLQQLVLSNERSMDCVGPRDGLPCRVQSACSDGRSAIRLRARTILAAAAASSSDA